MSLSRFIATSTVVCTLALAGCAQTETAAPQVDDFLTSLRADYPVSFAKLADNVWVHSTNYTLPGQAPIGSNGLVIKDGDDVILVDGAWGELATVALMEAIKTEVGAPVTKMIITHHHADKISGVDAAERVGVQVFTHPDTPTLAARSGFAVPNTSVAALKEPRSRTKIGNIELAFPGAAHAPDNLVVYIPEAKILYAGSAVRGAGITTLGNIEDADLTAWPAALRWVKATYPEAATVVPRRGKGGNLSLIDQTLAMVATTVNNQQHPLSNAENEAVK